MTRESIFAEVAAERARQDGLFGGATHDDQHSPAEWVAILTRHVGLSTDDGSPAGVCLMNHQVAGSDPARWRRQLVRVAAVAIAALESYERRLALVTTPADPLQEMAQQLANQWGETVLVVRDPPPALEQERHLPYVVLLSQASAKEVAVGVKVKAEGRVSP